MIALLSPSKSQDYDTPLRTERFTLPRFQEQSAELIALLRQYSPEQIMALMHLSENLADLNCARYQNYDKEYTELNSRPSLLAFTGDVYTHIQVEQYTEEDFAFAQQHLRTISGLYGLLRPLDRIQPYRLEMKTKLNTPKGKDLYAFWGSALRDALEKDLAEQGDQIVINLASQEYAKAVQLDQIDAKVIEVTFLEQKGNDEPKIIAIYSKLARGMMANFLIKNRCQQPEELQAFDQEGYHFEKAQSSDQQYVFLRHL